jgi:hypothetical protein
MNKLTIGNLSLDICQNPSDILYSRFVMFKQYVPQVFEKLDSPLWEVYQDRIKKAANDKNIWQIVIECQNYSFAIKQVAENIDAWGICFALITLEPGEDKAKHDEGFLKEKIERLNKEGLTYSIVKKEVINFMTTSPDVFMVHLEMLKMFYGNEINI